MLGSNQRMLSRRFYSPALLHGVYAADQDIRPWRRDCGLPPSAMRPWAPDSGAVRATDEGGSGHGRARKRPRTGPVGAVTLTASPAFRI
jgi:hypothetical protein